MLKVYPGAQGRLTSLRVIEHDLHFNREGWADGSELTQAEIERLRKFHFFLEEIKEPNDELPVDDTHDELEQTGLLEDNSDSKPKRGGRRSKTQSE